MTRIGTGLGSRTRAYAAQLTTTFKQLESANPNGSVVPTPGFVVVLATNPARTLDSAYTQGIAIENLSQTESIYVGGPEFANLVATDTPASPAGGVTYSSTCWVIPPNKTMSFDVRDGSGIYIAASSTITCRVFGN